MGCTNQLNSLEDIRSSSTVDPYTNKSKHDTKTTGYLPERNKHFVMYQAREHIEPPFWFKQGYLEEQSEVQ